MHICLCRPYTSLSRRLPPEGDGKAAGLGGLSNKAGGEIWPSDWSVNCPKSVDSSHALWVGGGSPPAAQILQYHRAVGEPWPAGGWGEESEDGLTSSEPHFPYLCGGKVDCDFSDSSQLPDVQSLVRREINLLCPGSCSFRDCLWSPR